MTVTGRDPAELRRRGLWRDSTFVDDLLALAGEAPERTAVVSYRWVESDRPSVTLSYRELAARTDRVAAALVGLGVSRGDRVAMFFANSWQATVTVLACARISAIVMPIFVGTGTAEIVNLLRVADARVACGPARHADVEIGAELAAARADLPGLRHLVLDGADLPDGARSFADDMLGTAWEEQVTDLDARRPAADDPFQVMYTSGTSGEPKGVLHSYNTLYAATRGYTVPMGFGPDDVLITPMAVGGQAGFLYGLLAPLVAGCTAVWGDRFRAPAMLDTMAEHGVTGLYTIPMIIEELGVEQRKQPRELRLRRLVTGSAPIPASLPTEARDTFGVALHPLWGMTENGGVTIGRVDDPWDEATRSDGRPVDGMAVRIVDEEHRPVPVGTPGSLEIHGANQCLGYFQDEARYAEQVHDGWFATGDLARADERGAVKIVGRLVDEIRRAGLLLPVEKVEEALRAHAAVREVALVGEPDEQLGQRVVAFVVRTEGAADGAPSCADLGATVSAAGLSAGYSPDRVEYLDALPRNPAGKLLRRELRALLDNA